MCPNGVKFENRNKRTNFRLFFVSGEVLIILHEKYNRKILFIQVVYSSTEPHPQNLTKCLCSEPPFGSRTSSNIDVIIHTVAPFAT